MFNSLQQYDYKLGEKQIRHMIDRQKLMSANNTTNELDVLRMKLQKLEESIFREKEIIERRDKILAVFGDGTQKNSTKSPDDQEFDLTNHQLTGREFPLHHRHVSFIGKRKLNEVFLTIGIPTVYRSSNGYDYLRQTINSFINSTKESEKHDVVVLIYAADTDIDRRQTIIDFVASSYKDELASGLILLMTVAEEAYPRLTNLKRNFNDTPERVRWRSKQVVDVSFVFYVGRSFSKYYMHMEDDTVASDNYLQLIKDFIQEQVDPWTCLSFSELFSIGRLFKSMDVDRIAKYLFMFYDEMPFDWLFSNYFSLVAEGPIYRIPTLFQNIGYDSSLSGKNMSSVKDNSFISSLRKRISPRGFPLIVSNPPADVFSTIRIFQTYLPAYAYRDPGPFFWGVHPKQNDTLTIVFRKPVVIQNVYLEMGHPDHPNDVLHHAVLETCYSMWSIPSIIKGEPYCTGCFTLGNFTETPGNTLTMQGVEKKVPFTSRCLKLRVTESQGEWVIINQVLVVPYVGPPPWMRATTTVPPSPPKKDQLRTMRQDLRPRRAIKRKHNR